MIYSWKKIVIHGLPVLTFVALIGVFAGQILQSREQMLVSLPILLVSIPVINSIAGNIGSILGARLASGLHVGYISISLKDKEMHQNLFISVLLGFITYFILAIVIYYVVVFSNIATEELALTTFVGIFVLTGFLLICVVAVFSILTAFISFKRGLDPDDMVAPVVTTAADIMGVIFLFMILGFFGV
jgi:mgtE-like transporter